MASGKGCILPEKLSVVAVVSYQYGLVHFRDSVSFFCHINKQERLRYLISRSLSTHVSDFDHPGGLSFFTCLAHITNIYITPPSPMSSKQLQASREGGSSSVSPDMVSTPRELPSKVIMPLALRACLVVRNPTRRKLRLQIRLVVV